jgi:hypothetical protein
MMNLTAIESTTKMKETIIEATLIVMKKTTKRTTTVMD